MNDDESTSLPDLVRRGAAKFGATRALETTGPGAETLTYNELDETMRRGAARLRADGLQNGDRVLLALEPRPAWASAFFAILDAGLIAVPVPPDMPEAGVSAVARAAGIRASVTSTRTGHLTEHLDDTLRLDIDDLSAAAVEARPATPGPPAELALLAFTSGSTQRPRAVELTHRSVVANLTALLSVRDGSPGDAMLAMLPLAHMFGLVVGLLAPLACGARVVFASSVLPNRLSAALAEQRITHALAVPALLAALYGDILDQLISIGAVDGEERHRSPREIVQQLSLMDTESRDELRSAIRGRIGDSFHTMVVGGAAADPALTMLLGAAGVRLEIGYGLTEASPVVSLGLAGQCPPGSVGRPLPGVTVRIDERGEILVRGPNVMRGYLGDAAATAAALSDGWLHTGDRGALDDDGFLFITGRIKEAMVTAAGGTIYPEEIEPCYASLLFAEWCVAGLSGPDGNDLPTLFVVPASEDTADAEIEETCATLRADAPARLRVHRVVIARQGLPRTATGKIRRRLLAERFASEDSC